MHQNTDHQFDSVIVKCKAVFTGKMHDYGTAWRILRPSSLTDQIFIKASRIRSIEDKGTSKVDEGVIPEFMGIVNYSIMALIQLELGCSDDVQMKEQKTEMLFDEYAAKAKNLMLDKNHDYGEAWRSMRVSSLTDIILMKLLRIKQIEDNQGKTKISEGLDANYLDIINYAIFSLIRLTET
jgi:hypothetical protein